MNLLDENIPVDQRDLLQAWGIHCRMIGQDMSYASIADDNILALLHGLKQPTFFTRDRHFFLKQLCHNSYCLVWLDLAPEESALFIRRFLSHPQFRTASRRLGRVVRVHHDGLQFWLLKKARLQSTGWSR